MTFSMSLLSTFSGTISLNTFEKLYKALLGLRIIIDNNFLKYDSQWPNSMHVSAILIRFLRYVIFLTIVLRYLQDNLLGLEVNKLLYFVIALVNSSSENSFHHVIGLLGVSSNKSMLIWWFCTKLNDKWRACHRLSNSRHSWLLYLKSLKFFGQRTCVLCLVILIVHLKLFQSSIHFEVLYFSSSL